MEELLQGKYIPVEQTNEFLNFKKIQDDKIKAVLEEQRGGKGEIAAVDKKMALLLYQLYERLHQMLSQNKIIATDSTGTDNKIMLATIQQQNISTSQHQINQLEIIDILKQNNHEMQQSINYAMTQQFETIQNFIIGFQKFNLTQLNKFFGSRPTMNEDDIFDLRRQLNRQNQQDNRNINEQMKEITPSAINPRKMMMNEPQEETKQQVRNENIQAQSLNSNNYGKLETQLDQLQDKIAQQFQQQQPNLENQVIKIDDTIAKVAQVGSNKITNIQNTILHKSKCATEDQQKLNLLKILGKQKVDAELLYRGSDHGWKYKDFHSRCDNKGATISLFKVQDGDLIGGFTSASWTSDIESIDDKNAMLFNLSKGRKFPSKQTGREIQCGSKFGPSFSGSQLKYSLSAFDEPFNGIGKCTSHADKHTYGIQFDMQGKNMLTNKNDGHFTISELEVWKIL